MTKATYYTILCSKCHTNYFTHYKLKYNTIKQFSLYKQSIYFYLQTNYEDIWII